MRWLLLLLLDFDGEASKGDEEGERLWWVRWEGAGINGEKEELEVGQPGDEEGSDAGGEDGGESERENGEEEEDRYQREKPELALGNPRCYEIAVTERE